MTKKSLVFRRTKRNVSLLTVVVREYHYDSYEEAAKELNWDIKNLLIKGSYWDRVEVRDVIGIVPNDAVYRSLLQLGAYRTHKKIYSNHDTDPNYRRGPASRWPYGGVGFSRRGRSGGMMRRPKTHHHNKHCVPDEEYDVKGRNKKLPTSWDDIIVSHHRNNNWKRYRRNQYR